MTIPVRLEGGRRRPRSLRIVGYGLTLLGLALLVEAGLTLLWREPVTSILTARHQARAAAELERLERRQTADDDRSRSEAERIAVRAADLRVRAHSGQGVMRIRVPRIGLDAVVINGADDDELRHGPGLYAGSVYPGESGTTAIAGHRTTYSAPLRRIDDLRSGDAVDVRTPYATVAYRVRRIVIVKPQELWVLRHRRGRRQLVLTACHPLYGDAERIVVFADLRRAWEHSEAQVAGGRSAEPMLEAV